MTQWALSGPFHQLPGTSTVAPRATDRGSLRASPTGRKLGSREQNSVPLPSLRFPKHQRSEQGVCNHLFVGPT